MLKIITNIVEYKECPDCENKVCVSAFACECHYNFEKSIASDLLKFELKNNENKKDAEKDATYNQATTTKNKI